MLRDQFPVGPRAVRVLKSAETLERRRDSLHMKREMRATEDDSADRAGVSRFAVILNERGRVITDIILDGIETDRISGRLSGPVTG